MGEAEHQQRIALFGGTFDPVHSGHLEVAQQAVLTHALDKVIFLPCRQSPHKATVAGATEEERLKMLQLATEGLSWAEVSDWEYHQPIPSFSWRTAEVFREKFSGSQLFWLMGWDQWKVLPTWSRFPHLATLVEFIVHARDGEGGEELLHPSTRVNFVAGNHAASSSSIRASLEHGEEVPGGWLDPRVEKFVLKQSLYK